MHKTSEIESAASAIANQLSAGIPLREAVHRMIKIQPAHSLFWQEASGYLSKGYRLSDYFKLQAEPVWPLEYISAIKAGEEAGSLEQIFFKIAQSSRIKQQITKVYGKLVSPMAAFIGGLIMFVFFLGFVIPTTQKNMGGTEDSLVKFGNMLNLFLVNYWYMAVGVVGAIIAYCVYWLSKEYNRQILFGYLVKVPKLGEALKWIYFGQWAYQIAVLDTAGIPVKQQLLLAQTTLPNCWQEGVQRMAGEVEKRGLADASDPDKQTEGDPRQDWPFYIAVAFMTAHETGRIDKEMGRCAPILVEEGMTKLNKFIAIADIISKLSAAVMIGIPMLGYFNQMANSLSSAFK